MAWFLSLPDKYPPYIVKQMPWQEPGTTMSPRCIGKGTRFKPHMTMRPLEDGSLACRLYSDDVVVYHPDGRISIDVSYRTTSTTIFASELLPGTIRADSCGGSIKLNGYYWHDDEKHGQVRIYNTSELSIEKDKNGHWRPIGTPEPFSKWVVNRSRAKEICAKYRFADFGKFLQMYLTMSGHRWRQDLSHYRAKRAFKQVGYIDFRESQQDLADQSRWSELGDHIGRTLSSMAAYERPSVATIMRKLREHVYAQEGGYTRIEVPYVTSWKELQAIKASRRLGY
jgi:hypothetical protein